MNIFKIILLFIILYSGFAQYKNANSQTTPSEDDGDEISAKGLTIFCKIYLDNGVPYYTNKKADVNVIIEKLDESGVLGTNKYNVKSNGRFFTELEPDKKYMIHVSKNNYETKCFILSTYKMLVDYGRPIALDILLKKKGAADYDCTNPVVAIEYNTISRSFECTCLQESELFKPEPLYNDKNSTARWAF